MFGIENLLDGVFHGNKELVALAAFLGLILLNLLVKVYVEIKKKDFNIHDVTNFIQPVVLYTVFLIGMDLLVATSGDLPGVREIFQGIQIVGYVAIMSKYAFRFYKNLQEAGMPKDERIDSAFENHLTGAAENTREDIAHIVEEYMRQKENKEKKEAE